MRELEQAKHARRSHRTAAGDRVAQRHRAAVGLEEPVGPRGGRRRFPPVVAAQQLLLLVPVQQEGAAADAGGLRLDEAQHHLHRDRRVHRTAAAREHRTACLDRQRMRCRDDEGFCGNSLSGF
jgi:hypothetical protein